MFLQKSLQRYDVKKATCYPPNRVFLKKCEIYFLTDNVTFNASRKRYHSEKNRILTFLSEKYPFWGVMTGRAVIDKINT